jgi:hypothetical protein
MGRSSSQILAKPRFDNEESDYGCRQARYSRELFILSYSLPAHQKTVIGIYSGGGFLMGCVELSLAQQRVR